MRLGEGLLAQVVGSQRPQRVDRLDEEGRAVRRERLGAGRERLATLVEQCLEGRRIGDSGLEPARDDHCLDALGS